MASPVINMGRVVRKNSAASFTFQLPQSGVAANDISFQAYRHDTSGNNPTVQSSVVETSTPGTYQITVAASEMVDGGVYYAAIAYDNIAFRIPAWSYAPLNEFDKVIADLAALDTHLSNVQTALNGDITNAVSTLQGDIGTAVTTINGSIATSQTAVQGSITAAQTALHGDITGAVTTLEGDITSAKNDVTTAVSNAVTTLEGDINAAVTAIDNHTDSKVDSAVTTINGSISASQTAVQGSITSAQTAVQGSITSAVTTLEGDITSAKTAIQGDITSAKTAIQGDITAAVSTIDAYTLATVGAAQTALSGDITAAKVAVQGSITSAVTTLEGDITSAKNSIEGLVNTRANSLDSAVAAVDSKALAAKNASESLVADFADAAGGSPAGRLKGLLDGIASDASSAKAAAQAVQSEVGVYNGTFGDLSSLLGAAQFSTDGRSLYTRLGSLDSQLADKYTLAQGVTDQNALLGRFSNVDSAISAVKALMDTALVENAKLVPNVPSSILSPMSEQIMRVSCNVTGPSGTSLAGALEDPDNQEVGVRLYMSNGADGSLVEISADHLHEDGAKAVALPSCSGVANGVPSTYKKMKRAAVGQYYAFVKLDAYKHGNMQWDFMIVDSDPSSTPQMYQTVRYTEIRRQVSFTSYGSF